MTDPSAHDPASDAKQADRYRAAREELDRRGLRDFLEFLCDDNTVATIIPGGVRLCAPDGHGDWMPLEPELGHLGEKLFAAYFEIDLDAVERHRQTVLDQCARDHAARQEASPT